MKTAYEKPITEVYKYSLIDVVSTSTDPEYPLEPDAQNQAFKDIVA